MLGYYKLGDNTVEGSACYWNRVRDVCFGALSAGFVILFTDIIPGGLPLFSISHRFPVLRVHIASKDRSQFVSIVNMIQIGKGQSTHRIGFGPLLQQFAKSHDRYGRPAGRYQPQHDILEQPLRQQQGLRFADAPMRRPVRGATIVRGLVVPVDGSPTNAEQRGSQPLVRLLTWVSAKLVLRDLDVYTELDVSTPIATRIAQDSAYGDMIKLMEEVPLNDADAWMNEAMNLNPSLALRVLERRKRCGSEFDYKLLSELMQDHLECADKSFATEYLSATGGLTNASDVRKEYPFALELNGSTIATERKRTVGRGLQVPSADWEAYALSAEQRGMQQINRLLTWASAKRLIAEFDREESDNQNPDDIALAKIKEIPLADADKWIREAMRVSPSLALRLVQQRAKCASEFDYEKLAELAQEHLGRADKELMAKYTDLEAHADAMQSAEVETTQKAVAPDAVKAAVVATTAEGAAGNAETEAAQKAVAAETLTATAEANASKLVMTAEIAVANAETETAQKAVPVEAVKAAAEANSAELFEAAEVAAANGATKDGQLHADLVGLRLGPLKQKARSEQISPEAIENTIDSADHPQQAMIDLIVSSRIARAKAEENDKANAEANARAKAKHVASHVPPVLDADDDGPDHPIPGLEDFEEVIPGIKYRLKIGKENVEKNPRWDWVSTRYGAIGENLSLKGGPLEPCTPDGRFCYWDGTGQGLHEMCIAEKASNQHMNFQCIDKWAFAKKVRRDITLVGFQINCAATDERLPRVFKWTEDKVLALDGVLTMRKVRKDCPEAEQVDYSSPFTTTRTTTVDFFPGALRIDDYALETPETNEFDFLDPPEDNLSAVANNTLLLLHWFIGCLIASMIVATAGFARYQSDYLVSSEPLLQ